MADAMEFCSRGFVDYTFLGDAQIDMYGNLNSTVIGTHENPKVITDMAVMDFEPDSKRMRVISVHSGYDVRDNCGFELLFRDTIEETLPPRPEELRILREEVDPYGYIIGR